MRNSIKDASSGVPWPSNRPRAMPHIRNEEEAVEVVEIDALRPKSLQDLLIEVHTAARRYQIVCHTVIFQDLAAAFQEWRQIKVARCCGSRIDGIGELDVLVREFGEVPVRVVIDEVPVEIRPEGRYGSHQEARVRPERYPREHVVLVRVDPVVVELVQRRQLRGRQTFGRRRIRAQQRLEVEIAPKRIADNVVD